jgi:RNA polymerase sigma factor (TIGR02999 family)
MGESSSPEGLVSQLLRDAQGGESSALDQLLPLVYEELRHLAKRHLRKQGQSHTLQATELVHEAYAKLSSGEGFKAENRPHLLAVASRAMRNLLVDHARNRKAQKRGGDWVRITLTDGVGPRETSPEEILTLDRALDELEPRQRKVVECRFFGGMEESEIAQALEVSERTVRRDWVKARAWLYSRLYPDDLPESAHGL